MSAACDCLYYEWYGPTQGSATLSPAGEYSSYPYFILNIDGVDYYIFTTDGVDFDISDSLGGTSYGLYKDSDGCPDGDFNGYWQDLSGPLSEYTIQASPCGFSDCCFSAIHQIRETSFNELNFTFASRAGIWNAAPYWLWSIVDSGTTLYFSMVRIETGTNECSWVIYELANPTDDPDTGTANAELTSECGCPVGAFENFDGNTLSFVAASCRIKCVPIQDRIFRVYESIKLPVPFEEQDRGWRDCCDCPMLVLAGGPTESWKNDVTSAWIKLSDPSDSVNFILTKDGLPTTYVCPVYSFPNEADAYYTTIEWRDVLSSDGAGCYKLEIEYNISGLTGLLGWGIYNLKPYSIQNALKTARIRVKFNLNQEIEGINFTDANVEDCIRFYGFIGDRQPNTEIDNLIYQDRKLKSVVRENLDTYIITTDPLKECFIRPLTDLYLLSENEMWISDYNVHNHSYRILDTPVILEESPEIDYLDRWQRRAILTAKVGIKTKNRRTHY